MGEDTRILTGLPAVAGKPVHVGFDGGRLTSDGGILLLAAIDCGRLSRRQRLRCAQIRSRLQARWRSGGCRKAARICARSRPSAGSKTLPGAIALKRMMAAMVELFCDSFDAVPRRILLDIDDDTEDRVHGGQQLSLWNAHYVSSARYRIISAN
jgi:hypothetical protein